MTKLSKIVANDITSLRLTDEDEDLIDRPLILIDALEKNTSISSISFKASTK